jgi:hypothetical protein
MDDQQRPRPDDPPTSAVPPTDDPGSIDAPPPAPDSPPTAVPLPAASEPMATPDAPAATPSSGWVGTSGPVDGSAPLPPPSSDTTGRIARVLIVLGVLAALFVGSFVVRGAISGLFTSEHEKAATEAGERILAMPAFEARYGDVDSADRAFDVGQELVTTALPRLSPAELDQYWRATAEILNVADPEVCGKILRQTATREEAEAAAKALDIGTWRTLLSVTVVAIERELQGVEGSPAPTDTELTAAYEALAIQMGEAQVVATGNTMNDPAATNAAVCDAGKAFLAGVLALEETPKQTILRFMVSP